MMKGKNNDMDKSNKIEGVVVKPNSREDEIFEKLMGMFEMQGIEVKKDKES